MYFPGAHGASWGGGHGGEQARKTTWKSFRKSEKKPTKIMEKRAKKMERPISRPYPNGVPGGTMESPWEGSPQRSEARDLASRTPLGSSRDAQGSQGWNPRAGPRDPRGASRSPIGLRDPNWPHWTPIGFIGTPGIPG